MATLNTSVDTINDKFKDIQLQLGTFGKQTKTLQEDLRSLQKLYKQTNKIARIKQKRPQVALNLSNELETFLSVEHGTKLTKAEVMKSISSYIKQKDLQLAQDRRKFLPNKPLSKIFNIKKAQNMTFVEINKHVSHHLSQ
jgi:chromatin remodeling complex protein RSC6